MKHTTFIGKKWILEVFNNSKRGVVVAVTNSISATAVETWRSPTNYTSEVVSNLGLWTTIPNYIRRRAWGLLNKWEKSKAE
jgi:hypothetical protein